MWCVCVCVCVCRCVLKLLMWLHLCTHTNAQRGLYAVSKSPLPPVSQCNAHVSRRNTLNWLCLLSFLNVETAFEFVTHYSLIQPNRTVGFYQGFLLRKKAPIRHFVIISPQIPILTLKSQISLTHIWLILGYQVYYIMFKNCFNAHICT